MIKTVKLLLLALLLPMAATAQTEGVNFVEGKTLYEVLQMGAQQQKMVFVDCYTTWCGPCKIMATREFTKKEAGDYFNAKFVNAKFDMEAGEGPDIARKYQIAAYPTFLILDEKGNMVHRVVGSADITEFIRRVEAGLTGKSLSSYQKEYAEGERSEAFLKDYLGVLAEQYMRDEAAQVAQDLLRGKTSQAIVTDSALFMAFVAHSSPGVEDPRFIEVCRLRDEVKQRHGDDGITVLTMIWRNAMQACINEDKLDTEKVEKIKTQMRECGFGEEADGCEEQVKQSLAYRVLRQALEAEDGPALLKASQDYETYLVKDFSTEEGITSHITEEVVYANNLSALAKLMANDKTTVSYVKKQVKERTKLFENARSLMSREFDIDGKKQTLVDYVIMLYQRAIDTADKKEVPAPSSVPAARIQR